MGMRGEWWDGESLWGKGEQSGAKREKNKKIKISTTAMYLHYLWQIEWTPKCINAVIVSSWGDCFSFDIHGKYKDKKELPHMQVCMFVQVI